MSLRATLTVVADSSHLRQCDIADIATQVHEMVKEGAHLSLFILHDGRVDVCAAGSLSQHLLARDYPNRMVGTYGPGTLRDAIIDDLRCMND